MSAPIQFCRPGINHRNWRSILLILMIISASACSTIGVEPWERDILSQPDMQFTATDLSINMSRQFYSSKEGSHGGAAFAGGGCGCN